MLTKKQIEEAGYTVLPKGGWFAIDANMIPHEWETVCRNLDVDPDCKEVILCVCGVKEINEENEQ